MSHQVEVQLHVNGAAYKRTIPTNLLLIDYLREHLALTGTKMGCGIGVCGACTVLLDGRPVSSCLMPAVLADGHQVESIEGMNQTSAAGAPELNAVQQAFVAHEGLQCGICTPGQVISACALLKENPHPTEGEIRHWMAGNLCRCTGYQSILRAIRAAAGEEVEEEHARL
jgi:carbon-monoxide dehydrogenase small subunit